MKFLQLSVMISFTAVTFYANFAYSDKITQPAPFPMVQDVLVGISKFAAPNEKTAPWGLCLGTRISARKILTAGHCVTQGPTSKDVSPEIYVSNFLSGTRVFKIDAAHIKIHPNYVPAEKENGQFSSRTGFDLAILELPEAAPNEGFPLGHDFKNLTEEFEKNESCGVALYREAGLSGGRSKWMPVFVPLSIMKESKPFLSRLFGAKTKDASEYDLIVGNSTAEVYGGDSGAPVICQNSQSQFSLVGVLRGGGRGQEATTVIMVDAYFDKWVIQNR